jgi:hypothetical protein
MPTPRYDALAVRTLFFVAVMIVVAVVMWLMGW